MCGIYSTNISFTEEQITQKLGQINFRGPDNLGVLQVGTVSMGHLRLAILDLDKRSNQPYSFEQYTIVYNGEIYNYKDIQAELVTEGYCFETTSDTEVLIKGYHCWGEQLLPKLNGMFAFVIYDSQTQQMFCARDRMGVKPFYYYWKEGKFEICSQIKPIFNSDLKVSKEAINIYLDCGYIPSPYTIFDDVYKLPPGCILKIDPLQRTKTVMPYWDLQMEQEQSALSYDEAKAQLHELLIDAVKIRMQSDVPLGSFLSGGIDSALVTAIASKLSDTPINTFTIASDDPKYDESKVARQYADIIGSNHREMVCDAKAMLEMLPVFQQVYDEPFADSSALPSLLVNKVTKQWVTVALSGDGGDESFMGYTHFEYIDKFKKISKIPYFIRKVASYLPFHWFLGTKPETIKEILQAKTPEDFAKQCYISLQTINLKRNTNWLQKHYQKYLGLSTDTLQQVADFHIKLWLENDSNVKVDRASMAFSVESRSPFLDYRIVEFARTLPVHYRYDGVTTKKIIRDILEEYIPREVFTQPKRGFSVPLEHWLRNELRADVQQKLNDDFLQTVPNLNINKFKQQLTDHLSGKRNYVTNVWRLYVLALWKEEFRVSLKIN